MRKGSSQIHECFENGCSVSGGRLHAIVDPLMEVMEHAHL